MKWCSLLLIVPTNQISETRFTLLRCPIRIYIFSMLRMILRVTLIILSLNYPSAEESHTNVCVIKLK